jgi:hypothetical protein
MMSKQAIVMAAVAHPKISQAPSAPNVESIHA